jgi:predicted transcriptional regulator
MQIPTGEELRSARKSRGLTQAEVAQRAGVSQPIIARVESEDVDPTLATLHAIVSALNDSETSIDQDKIDLVVPSALREARKQGGYTQSELAEAANVSQPLISRIESEDVNPRASTLRSLFEHVDMVSTIDNGGTVTTLDTDSNVLAEVESELQKLRSQRRLTE